ncbi:hypothetical protein [Nitratidesulfovibrio liaohensis]|uniref:Uncharacterized protein n=1 Tax=Nitratidesulfovibrio liaohensis TaxID=2604158 RepID=A0ABY9R2Z0_9BACT|nr:hypothetical protein [Nitratidesulfovibrio liaohensis]WMW65358.1 hypothetical protein KPS_003479 [Nitratidesulfovibrio liaohensis]
MPSWSSTLVSARLARLTRLARLARQTRRADWRAEEEDEDGAGRCGGAGRSLPEVCGVVP